MASYDQIIVQPASLNSLLSFALIGLIAAICMGAVAFLLIQLSRQNARAQDNPTAYANTRISRWGAWLAVAAVLICMGTLWFITMQKDAFHQDLANRQEAALVYQLGYQDVTVTVGDNDQNTFTALDPHGRKVSGRLMYQGEEDFYIVVVDEQS
jgi:heme/copper-type cytochrome/quinol oxidase subunit 2